MTMIKLTCPRCGSMNVTRDTISTWNVINQDWMSTILLDTMNCQDCEGEFKELTEVPLTQEEIDQL